MQSLARHIALATIVAFGVVCTVQSAVLTYDGDTSTSGAQDGAGIGWNTANVNFWDGVGNVSWPNTTADEAIFGSGSGTAGTVNVGTVNVNTITFNAPGSGSYVISGGSISLAGTTPTIAANSNASIASVLVGAAGLIKTGSGTLTLGGASTFTGSVYVNEGILKIGNQIGLGAANTAVTKVIVAAGATVDFNGVVDASYGYTIAGTGAAGTGAIINTGNAIGNSNLQSTRLKLAGDAMIGGTGNFALLATGYGATQLDLNGFTLTKAGTNTFTVSNATFTAGSIRIAGGGFTQFSRAHDASMVAFSLDDTTGATLNLGSYNLTVGSLAGGGSTGGNVTLGENTLSVGALGTSTTYSGRISGAGNVTKTGSGTLTLAGTNTFTGTATVSGGVLAIGNANAFGSANTSTTKVVFNSGGTVDLNGIGDALYGYTIAGTGAGGVGAIVNNGASIGTGTAQMSNLTLAANATIGGTGNFALLASGHGATALDLAGRTFTKAGTNTFTVSNTTFTAGTIHIAGGTFSQVTRAHDASMVAFTFANNAGAGLALNGHDLSVGSLTGGGSTGGGVNLGNNTLTVGDLDTSTTYSGIISGADGSLIKTGSGTLTLSGASTFTGSVYVNEGVLKIGNRLGLGAANTAVTKVIVAAGATVDFNGVGDASYGYTIAGTGTAGTGTIINTGNAIGNTTLQSTRFKLAADAMIGGTGNFALLATGYGATQLDLNGFTLTKAGTNTFTVCNTTFTAGAIHIAEGTFTQHRHAHDASMVAFSLDNTTGTILNLGSYNLSVGSLAGGGSTGGNVGLGTNTLTVGALGTSTTYGGVISGEGGLIKVGTGTLTLAGANAYAGTTAVNAGTLQVNGTHSAGGLYTVAGAKLAGTGVIDATVSIASGGVHSPGNSVGSQTVSGEIWNPGGRFELEVNNAAGAAGGPSGWDLLTISNGNGSGRLDLSALDSANPFILDLVSLDGDQAGLAAGFLATQPYDWEFVTYEQLDGSFSPDLFVVNISGFQNSPGTGYFTVAQTGSGLAVSFVPEPNALLIGMAGLLFALRRRRRV
ncbi:MAG: autotransporter-associated beta strand repeat-containing protein [Patescibacteria group bacterium]|nr:autotransporter-associated beta strand repeat-containing protein [Patescibacteria group bacterium]